MPDDDVPVPEDDDPFAGLQLDDDFVRGATTRELSAERRARRAELLREEADELVRRRRAKKREQRPDRRAARTLRDRGRVLLIIALLVGATLVTARLRGNGSSKSTTKRTTPTTSRIATAADQPTARVATGDHPTPKAAGSSIPLGRAAALPAATGPYQFLATQPGSSAPVAYDPCRPIEVVVNNRTRPRLASDVVQDALAEVTSASGLQFHVQGASDEAPREDRPAFLPQRYGDQWAPVLIAWTDPTETPGLAGDVAGEASSTSITTDKNVRVYVSGIVMLDGPQIASIERQRRGDIAVRTIVMHELGHLLGLDHVSDTREVMHPTATDATDWGPGDRHGLVQLGSGPCIPKL